MTVLNVKLPSCPLLPGYGPDQRYAVRLEASMDVEQDY